MNSTYEHIRKCIEIIKESDQSATGLTLFANYHNELYPAFNGIPTNREFIWQMHELDESAYEDGLQQEDQFIAIITEAIDKLIAENALLEIIKEKPFPIFYRFWDHKKHLHFIYRAKNPSPFFPEVNKNIELKTPNSTEFDSNKWWRLIPFSVTSAYPKYKHFYEQNHIEFLYKNEEWIDFETAESLKDKTVDIQFDSDDVLLKLWDVPYYENALVVSYKLALLLQKLNIRNIEFYPAKITDIVREETSEDYYKIVNILDKTEAFSYYKEEGGKVSKFITYQHQIRGISNKLHELENTFIARPSKRKRDIVVNDFIKAACELNNFSGLYFEKIPIY